MKQTKLTKIEIKNFKGIANGTFNFNEDKTEIVADVMQGKSTIKDAYLFALGMEIDNFYPTNKNNELIDGLETSVELTLDIDGITYTLSRGAKVKWKVNKETNQKLFDGYKKDIFAFDGVPCIATEYKQKVCDLFGVSDFETLKYISVLNYFNEEVNWKERRELIYNLFVEPTSLESLKTSEKYSLLRNELLKGKSTADINTMLNSENNKLVDSKRKCEILLADSKSELANFEKIDYNSIESEIEQLDKQIEVETARLQELKSEDNKASLELRIATLSHSCSSLIQDDTNEKLSINLNIKRLQNQVNELKAKGTHLEHNIEELTAQYKKIKVSEFDNSTTICPMCKQSLPQADIDKLKANWESDKENNLTRLKNTINDFKQQLEQVKQEYTSKLVELDNQQKKVDEFKPNPLIAEIDKEIEELQEQLESATSVEIDTTTLDNLKAQKLMLVEELGKRSHYNHLLARIEQLTKEQQDLVNVEIDLLKKRSQLEQLTLDTIALINDSINANFDGVKFKLFKVQTQSSKKDIAECCEVTHNGVEYVSCSTGEKALINCIIVSTIQKKLGIESPIWLDDASILNLKNPPKNQLIYLVNEKGAKLNCTRIDDLY